MPNPSFPNIGLTRATNRASGPRSLTSALFLQLRSDLLGCRITPGERLSPSAIASTFSVSLSAVREALSRLVADGLVVAEDHKGFRAAPVSVVDLRDTTRTRIEIESIALRRSVALGDDAWEARVREMLRQVCDIPTRRAEDRSQPNEAWTAVHDSFHQALLSACGSEWLMRFRTTLFAQSERYRRMSFPSVAGGERDVAAEHRAIAEAALMRDAEAAIAALTLHYETTMANAVAAIAVALDPPGPNNPQK